jgi:single-strand DNA-binding protein
MNNVSLFGRLTRSIELHYTQGDNPLAMCNLNVAVDRKFKKDGQPTADFINCKAFGKTAEFIEKYFDKGNRIGLTGSIQTGSYKNKDGNTVYTTDVIVDNVEFVESKASSGSTPNNGRGIDVTGNEDFMKIEDNLDDSSLPFN